MTGQILGIVHNHKKKEQILSLCEKFGFKFREIRYSDLNTSMSKIIGMQGIKNSMPKKSAPVLYSPPELLVFYGIADKALDMFIDEYNQLGIEPIQLKGAITGFNIGWSPYEFILEYENETQNYLH